MRKSSSNRNGSVSLANGNEITVTGSIVRINLMSLSATAKDDKKEAPADKAERFLRVPVVVDRVDLRVHLSNAVVRCRRVPVPDVVVDRAVKQERFLEHQAHLTAQGRELERAHGRVHHAEIDVRHADDRAHGPRTENAVDAVPPADDVPGTYG